MAAVPAVDSVVRAPNNSIEVPLTVRYRLGHVSVHQAARILRVTYWTVLKLIARGELRGGKYRKLQNGRFVELDTVLQLHGQKLAQQTAAYHAARQHLEGVL